MIRIGDAFVNEDAIEAIFRTENTSATPETKVLVAIDLRSGQQFVTHASYQEVVAALKSCGLLSDGLLGQTLTQRDRERLIGLDRDGYCWIARDVDEKLYAYIYEPERTGGYWDTSRRDGTDGGLLLNVDFDSIDVSWEEPLHIRTVLQEYAREGAEP